MSEKLQLEDGGEFTWEFLHPVRLVEHVLEACPNLAKIYAAALMKHPSTPSRPWELQVGCDEHTPGNKVAIDNKRKNMTLVFNFLQLPDEVLECTSTWFVPIVVRDCQYKNIHGGWSVLLRLFLRHLLLGETSFTHSGVLAHYKATS